MSQDISRRQILAGLGATGLGATGLLTASSPAFGTATTPARLGRTRVLRLAHLTDTHVQPEKGGGEGMAACLRHVQTAYSGADKPEFILFGGDNLMNVDSAEGAARAPLQLDLWKSVLKNECSLAYSIAIGNHDVLGLNPTDGKKWAVDAFGLSARYYTFDRSGWRFLVLDSTSPEEGGYKGRIDAEQLAWISKTLDDTPKTTPVCILSHIPILGVCVFFDGDLIKTGNWQVPGSWMHVDAKPLKDIFYQHKNVRLCLSGHIHLADVCDYLGVRYACNGAVSGAWWGGSYHEFAPGYALVDLYDDGSSEIEFVTYGWEAHP